MQEPNLLGLILVTPLGIWLVSNTLAFIMRGKTGAHAVNAWFIEQIIFRLICVMLICLATKLGGENDSSKGGESGKKFCE